MPFRVTDHGDDEKALVLGAELHGFTPREVRRHLTEPDLLTTWWAEEADTDPRPGGGYVLRWPTPGHELRGTYARVDDEVVAFTWSFRGEDTPERRVTISIEGGDASTTVTIRHEHGGRADERAGYLDGWRHFLGRLAAHRP